MKRVKKRVKKSRYKIDWFRVLVVFSTLLGAGLLIHDFIFYAIVPFFNGMFYQMTYFGMFVEFFAVVLVDMGIQFIKEWL